MPVYLQDYLSEVVEILQEANFTKTSKFSLFFNKRAPKDLRQPSRPVLEPCDLS